MSEFNIKQLDPSVPQRVYSELNQAVNFGDKETTSKTVKDGKTGYLLGGLLLNDILHSSLSEDTIGRLSNALSSDNVSYAVFPNDIRQGQIPLILSDRVRNYINNNLPQLAQSQSVKWRVFFLPDDIDPDDNELASSEIINGEDGYPLALKLNELEDYFEENGQVNQIEDDAMYDDSVVNNQENNEEIETENNTDIDELDDGTPDIDSLDFKEDELEDSKDAFVPNENEENESDNKDENHNEPLTNPIENLDDSEEDLFENDSKTNRENKPQTLEQQKEKDISLQETDANGAELHEESETVKSYMKIPDTLQAVLDDVYIGRFNDFPEDEVYKESNKVMSKEIKNANEQIEMLTKNIKRGAKELYFNYMSKSYETIKATIDIENGNPKVIEQRHKVTQEEDRLDREFSEERNSKKEELENKFYGEQLEAYKQEVLAKIKQDFEDQFYEERVKNPLKDYEIDIKKEYDNQKYQIRDVFNAWITNVEDTAIDKDRNNAIKQASHYIETEMRKANHIVEEIDNKLVKLNDQYLKIESINKANENLRDSMGSDLLTDEEAKAYKNRLQEAAEEKAKLEKEYENIKAQHEQNIKDQKEQQEQEIESMKASHTKILENKDQEKAEITSELNDIKSSRDKLKQDKQKDRKKQIGTGIGGFAIAALIFGGTAFGIHGQNKGMEDKIDNQTKVAEQQKSKAEENKEKLDKLETDSKAEIEKQDKIIADQKKELEKAKKDKKDKKD